MKHGKKSGHEYSKEFLKQQMLNTTGAIKKQDDGMYNCQKWPSQEKARDGELHMTLQKVKTMDSSTDVV